jgi:hypothetical protein
MLQAGSLVWLNALALYPEEKTARLSCTWLFPKMLIRLQQSLNHSAGFCQLVPIP